MNNWRNHFRNATKRLCTVMALGCLLALPTQAETIYNNSTNDLRVRFNPASVEVGDEIILAGNSRFLTNFSFEYWGTAQNASGFAGPVEVRVRFYQNDGAAFNGYSAPGTVFYDSDWFSIPATERNTLVFTTGTDFPAQGLFVPSSNFTWSVQFQGMAAGDNVGVDIYSPVVVGQGYPDYWEHTATGWQLKTNLTIPMNFAAVLQGSPVPVKTQPVLNVSYSQGKVVLSWPLWAFDYFPEFSALVTGGTWTPLPDPIYRTQDEFIVTNVPSGNVQFYRLSQQ